MIKLAYLVDWKNWFPDEDHFRRLTHINYAFARIGNAKGIVIDTFERAHQIQRLKEYFPHLTVCLSIGGEGAPFFSETAAVAEHRQRFIESALNIVDRYGFDGINIDWESPCLPSDGVTAKPEDKKNFTLLVKELREALDEKSKETGKRYDLTLVVTGQMVSNEVMELDQITGYLDFIHVKTYDLHHSDVTSHHANLYPSKKYKPSSSASTIIETLIKQGVPREKLLIGVACYGRGAFGVTGAQDGIGVSYNHEQEILYSWTKISEEILKMPDVVEYWDEDAKAAYLYDGHIFLSYDNPTSVKEKARYAKDQGLAGVFLWDYSSDFYGELVSVLHETVEAMKQ